MSECKIGGTVLDRHVANTPRGTLLRHSGYGYFEVVEMPVAAPKIGDVIDSEAKAKALPVGSVIVDDDPGECYDQSRPCVKIGLSRWMYYGALLCDVSYEDDDFFEGYDHRVVFIPDRADAGTGRTAA